MLRERRRLSEPLQQATAKLASRRQSLPTRLDTRPPFVVPFYYHPPANTSTNKPKSSVSKPVSVSQKAPSLSPNEAARHRLQPRQHRPGPFPTKIPCPKVHAQARTPTIARIRYTPPSLRTPTSESPIIPVFTTVSPSPLSRVRQAVSEISNEPRLIKSNRLDLNLDRSYTEQHNSSRTTSKPVPLPVDTVVSPTHPVQLSIKCLDRKPSITINKSSPQCDRLPMATASSATQQHCEELTSSPVHDETMVIDSVFGPRRVRRVIVPPFSESSVPSRDPKIVTEIASLRAQKKVGNRVI